LVDAYAEIATLLAAWLRPAHLGLDTAVRRAQAELDKVASSDSPRPLVVELVQRIAARIGG
jgi:hypothetical protein